MRRCTGERRPPLLPCTLHAVVAAGVQERERCTQGHTQVGDPHLCLPAGIPPMHQCRQSITRASAGDIDNTPIIEKVQCQPPHLHTTACFHAVPPSFSLVATPPGPCHLEPSQVLALRQEKAELLGFKNFADVSMASKVRSCKADDASCSAGSASALDRPLNEGAYAHRRLSSGCRRTVPTS